MRKHDVRAEQPRRSDPGKYIEVANAKHHFRPAIDQPRLGDGRFAE